MKLRKLLKITGRTSSVTNSFVQSIIPGIVPSVKDFEIALTVLGMSHDHIVCAYCGADASDWDHLRPLVRSKRPTGYIHEIRNLVPSCGRCNQSKGASNWRKWIVGSAPGSPKTRGIAIEDRIASLERFEAWGKVEPLDLRSMAGAAIWDLHWENLSAIEAKMHEAQRLAATIQEAIATAMRERGESPTFPSAPAAIETSTAG